MHHYRGLRDPAAAAMIHRLRLILEAAEAVGITPGLTLLANEAYADSPRKLRADWTAGHDGYHAPPGGDAVQDAGPEAFARRAPFLALAYSFPAGVVGRLPGDAGRAALTPSRCKTNFGEIGKSHIIWPRVYSNDQLDRRKSEGIGFSNPGRMFFTQSCKGRGGGAGEKPSRGVSAHGA
jgi:hypothetical protein